MAEKMYPVYHNSGGDFSLGCNEVGMLTTVIDPQVGEPIFAKDFFHKDGKPFVANEETICDHCGEPMRIMIESIDYENPVEVENHGN